MATQDIEEWCDILETYSIRRLSWFLTATSERANRLHQSNPIFAILNAEERRRLLNFIRRTVFIYMVCLMLQIDEQLRENLLQWVHKTNEELKK